MKRSTDRILTTHAGSLSQPAELRTLLQRQAQGEAVDTDRLELQIREAVADSVSKQIGIGIDIINDGEQGKVGFGAYIGSRLGGVEWRGESTTSRRPLSRDFPKFPEYYGRAPQKRPTFAASGPITYTGRDEMVKDIARLKAAIGSQSPTESYASAISPANLEHWITNEHYPSQEAFLFGLADAVHEEYKLIVDAGLVLQIDNPDILNGFGIEYELSVPEWRKYQEQRIAAINHALHGIPSDRVRMHVCWGAYRGPHSSDIPLSAIIDLVYQFNVDGLSIEAANPAHQHEWRVFEEFPLPDGKILMPGVVGHDSDTIENAEVVAERLERYAGVVGKENVIACTDCGLGGTRVGHPLIAWAKLMAMVEGAQIASGRLWRS